MVNLPMHHVLEDGICRISLNGIVVGAGFLVTDRHILTCAHVVHTQAEGENILSVNFIKVADKELSAELIHSTPIRDDDFVHDIAVLALKEALPSAVKQLPLSFQKNIRGHAFQAIGFTSRFLQGETTEGTISNNQLQGAIQLEKNAGSSLKIDRGYSGGALWDTELHAVVGIVVASTNSPVALCIPLNYIAKVWLEWQRENPDLPSRFEVFERNPYKGLDYFQAADAERFYGREEESHDLYQTIQQQHFIAVVGNSGTGKSSVVFAGLVPKLQQDGDWTILESRPADDALYQLSESLVAHFEPQAGTRSTIKEIKAYKDDLQAGVLSLAELGEREKNTKNHKLLLIINQFEEFYTLGEQDKATKDRFLELLVESVASQHIRLIITIRTDFLSYVYEHASFGKLVRDNSYTILPIEGEAKLAQVITLPDQHGRARMQLSPELKARIIEDASGELALLQFALEELWERRQDGALTYEAYKEIGGVKGALERKAEDFMQSLKPAEQQQVRLIMFNLLKLGEGTEDTKRVASRAEIGEENWQMVSKLADERLLKTGEDAQQQVKTAEIIHEALIRNWTTLQKWLTDDVRAFLRWREGLGHQLQNWQENAQAKSALLTGLQLEQAKAYTQAKKQEDVKDFQAFLSDSEHSYIQQSVQEDSRQKRGRNLTRAAVVAALSLIAAVAVFFAFNTNQQRVEANKQREEAQKQTMLAEQRQIEAEEQRAEAQKQKELAEERQREAEQEREKAQQQQAKAEKQTNALLALDLSAAGVDAFNNPSAANDYSTAGMLMVNEARKLAARAEFTDVTLLNNSAYVLQQPWYKNLFRKSQLSAMSDDEKFLIVYQDTNLTLIDTIANEVVWHMPITEIGDIDEVEFSADDSRVFVRGTDAFVLYASADGREVWRVANSDVGDIILDETFSNDGSRVFVRGDDAVVLYASVDGREVWRAASSDFGADVTSTFSNDGSHVFVRGDDAFVLYTSADGSEVLRTVSDDIGKMQSANFNNDGSRVLVLGSDTFVLYNSSDGSEVWRVTNSDIEHPFFYMYSIFSNDGSHVFVVGFDVFVLYDSVDGSEVLRTVSDDIGKMQSAYFNNDGSRVFVLGYDAFVLYDSVNGSEILRITRDVENFLWYGHITFSYGGSHVLLRGSDVIVLYDSVDGSEVWRIPSSDIGDIRNMIFSYDGSRVLLRGSDVIVLYDSVDGSEVWRIPSSDIGDIQSITFSYDNSHVSVLGTDAFTLYSSADGSEVWRIPSSDIGSIGSVIFNHDSLRVLVSYDDAFVLYTSADGSEILRRVSSDIGSIRETIFSSDDSHVLVLGSDAFVLYGSSDGREILRIASSDIGKIQSANFNNDGSRVLVLGSDAFALYDSVDGSEILRRVSSNIGSIGGVIFSADGSRVLVLGSGAFVLYDSSDGREILHRDIDDFWGANTIFSADGSRVLVGERDSFMLYASEDGSEILRRVSSDIGGVWNTIFSADGSRVLALGSYGFVLYDSANGSEILRITSSDTGDIGSVTFSYDGSHVLTLGSYGFVLYDSANGRKVWRTASSDMGDTRSVTFSNDDSRVLVGGTDTVVLYASADGREVWRAASSDVGDIRDVTFSHDGSRMLFIGDEALMLHDAINGNLIWKGLRKGNKIQRSIVTSDSKYVIIATQDGGIELWDMASGDNLLQFSTGEPIENIHLGKNSQRLFIQHGNKISSLDIDIDGWYNKICERAGRNLYKAEWEQYFEFHPDTWEDYKNRAPQDRTCPQYEVYDSYEAYLHTFQPSN